MSMTIKRFIRDKAYTLPELLIAAIIALALLLSACARQPQSSNSSLPGTGGTNPAKVSPVLISRNVPAFASSEYSAADQANDGSYDTSWRSQGVPSWLAYDLSHVPAARRSTALVVWYNESYDYDHTLIENYAYNLPEDYTLEVNSAPGGGIPPDSGWRILVTVNGNHYHSRQHLIDMTGDNWLRIHVTASDGAPANMDISLNMDVYDASAGRVDDWVFFGDSITAGAMGHLTMGEIPSFAQLINSQEPDHFPVQESGGTSYLASADGAKYLKAWLQLFPGTYVALSYGTNDANGCVDPQTFYANYAGMIQTVLADGKIPLVPHLPWGKMDNIQRCGPALNHQIDILYKVFPRIIRGPDLWTFFQAHQSLISSDNIHPTDAGFGALRQQWANSVLASIYAKK